MQSAPSKAPSASVRNSSIDAAVRSAPVASPIRPRSNYEDFNDLDLIIEAVFESLELKKQIFAELDKIAKPECVLATNTSVLDIDTIAQSTSRPERPVGLHFFNPANVMRLLEIGDEEILDRCTHALINEGARILEERYALRSVDIDLVYLTGYGFPAYRGGPMFYADTFGLANVYARVLEFHRTHGNRWEPAPLLRRLAEEGKTFSSQS